ncbi:MAG: hypothetical protein Q7K57_51245 [Burkholderiaceae bacterium]|nr:hypothetical protein [Burkholderiaceae bacterium]
MFDDSVSSIDNRRRWDVAARLVAEAHHRQVIVFTHEFYYLGIVQQKVEELGAPLTAQYIRRTGKGTSCFLPAIEFNSPAIGYSISNSLM